MQRGASWSRRDFLQVSAALAAGVGAGGMASGQETRPATGAMPRRRLGKTGLEVPILEMGGSFNQSPVLVKRALELGINFFDTAASYMGGRAEGVVGKALSGLAERKQYMIVTKGSPKTPEEISARWLPQSLERLGMDYVDAWFIHNPEDASVLSSAPWREAVEKARKSGKMRFFGFSCHGRNVVDLLTAAAKAGFVDAIMLRYNFRSAGDAELNRALDAAHKAGVGLIAMKTQGSAVSFAERVNPFAEAGYSKHQAVLKAVWEDERIACCCSEMTSLAILEENAAAATQALSAEERRLIREWTERTAGLYCAGGSGLCRRQCEAAGGEPVAIADTLRCLMYYESYGRRRDARQLFGALPASVRPRLDQDLAAAEGACPMQVPVGRLIRRALERLA